MALLQALRDTLDLLAGNAFAAAFGSSSNQDDYRWGKLNRVTLAHPLDGSRSIPPAAGFSDLSPQLPGIARDGGYWTVNPGGGWNFQDTAINSQAFHFSDGSEYRLVAAAGHPLAGWERVLGFANIPGGSSGDSDIRSTPRSSRTGSRWTTTACP